MKVKIGKIEYEFKHITLPDDHGMDENALTLLMRLDEALVKSRESITDKKELTDLKTELEAKINEIKSDFNFGKFQEQLNAVFIKMEEIGMKPLVASKEENERKERELNTKWIRAFLKKDKDTFDLVDKELKTLEPIMHLGPATGSGSSDIGEDYTQGGYLIPTLLLAEVNRFAVEGGIARRDMRYLPFSGPGNSRYMPTLLTNVVVDWIDEGEKKPKTKPYISKVQQTLKKLAAMVILTEEIVEDTIIDLFSFCSQLIGEAIAAEEDNQFLAGIGAPWTGIINDPAITSLSLAAGVGPLNMRPESLLSLTVAIPATAVPGAKFYMNRQIWAAISARRSDSVAAGDSSGNYLVQTPGQPSPGTIWGFPIVLTDALPSLADLGYSGDLDADDTCDPDEPFLFFGNLGKCCAYGDKQGVRVKLLDQASVYDENDTLINLAEQDMTALRVHKRVGYVTILPAGIVILQTGPVS